MVIIMLGKNQYIKTVNAKGLFDNTYETRIPQTVVNKIILNHFEKADKKPKCLFIGWDGCRADSMKYLIKSADEKISGHNESNIYSAVSTLKKSGGLYITYVGGDNGLLQQTSTAQGWSCALCGKWLKPQWRTGANWSLDEDYPTVLKKLACEGYKTSFNAQWPEHFSNTYLLESQYAQKNNISEHFYKLDSDKHLFEHMLKQIASDVDLIFGIFEGPDHNGHSTGWGDKNYRYISGICSLDSISYYLIEQVKARQSYQDEDWLILIASDHGGHSHMHGSQRIEDRTTFLALSKPIRKFDK